MMEPGVIIVFRISIQIDFSQISFHFWNKKFDNYDKYFFFLK